ncbi:MAG: non-canonical purine NTP pyrophosphatase [Pirellulales bacterium]|nr:non-canonical purine NTP pyrophosphatase [Pirellulales bacterium]
MLVLGTTNLKKGQELAELLAPAGIAVATLSDFPPVLDVVEDGDSFAANAALKAQAQARRLQRWVLAEDSGLCVAALEGAPGVYSARFAGANATDEANNRLLLDQLAGVPTERRGAWYVCHATLAAPDGTIRAEAEETCRGRIRTEPVGQAGFGYDPLFEIVEYHRTVGELGATVKSCLSHRSRALKSILPAICRELAAT